MNSFTYYTNDGYFNDIITGYFDKKDNWKKTQKDISQVTFFNSLTQTCHKCKIVTNFVDTSALGNKKKLYKNLLKYAKSKSITLTYLPKTYSFTSNNILGFVDRFINNFETCDGPKFN